MAANERVSCWRRPGVVSLGTRTVTSIPALAMSIPAARSANSGSSSTSCISSSYDENAVTGVAVRGSCGQPEIWSAGSKHHVTALKDSSQRSDFAAGSSPPKDNDVSGRPHPHPGNRHRPGAASSPQPQAARTSQRASRLTHRPPPRHQRGSEPPPATAAQPRQFSRRYRVTWATDDWSENRTIAGQVAASGGAKRRRLWRCGGLAGGGREGAGVGDRGFDGDFVAEALEAPDVAAGLAVGVHALFVVVRAKVGVAGLGV